ncbi:MAG: DUF262 domain-containing protein [Clostridia bacterium]|nr:DUF262 domain-containing protein [Clostridia bacterium]
MNDKTRKLEEIYKSMKVELIEVTVNNLVISEERKNVKYAPSYQRNYIWSELKATNLIETVLMNGIVPPLTVIKKGKEIEIIDGRQRYETLLKFYNNQFKLNDSGLQKLKDWGDKTYNELAPNLKTLFGEYKIKMICYTVESSITASDKDVEYMKRDLFRRYNFGMTSLKSSEIARAKYYYDKLTFEFEQLFKSKKEFYDKCIELFCIGVKRKIDEREKINILLIIIREIITSTYIPIIGERNVQCSSTIIDKYYDEFIKKIPENELSNKLKEFEKIFDKLYLIKEKLKNVRNDLQNNPQFFKSIYWMLSILYNNFGNNFYDFNIDKFCHYVEDEGKDYFDTYNSNSGIDTQRRHNYMKEYMEKELKLDINIYLEKIKDNKKTIIYNKDSRISKDKDWNSPLLSQQLTTRKETMEIGEIIGHIKQNRFIVRPAYQRGEVLDKRKASKIIESIILGVKLPPIYLYTEIQENGLSTDIVLDGQQRLIDILKFMGEPVTDQDYEYIRTYKDKYALKGLQDLEDLNNKVFEEGPESINQFKREPIENYVFDVIRIDKKGNENIDFVDIFIRLNQNPCPISMNSFEMWNSFDITNTINKIKEIAKYKGFKQYRNTMKEELVTILAYMHYIELNIENINHFFKINLRTDNKNTKKEKSLIKISVRNKNEITKFLEKMRPNSEKEKEFLNSVNAVEDFVEKLKVIFEDEDALIKVLNPTKTKSKKGSKNSFYIMWLILQEFDLHIIQTYKKELVEYLKEVFKLMQNMPKDKKEDDFMDYVKSIISKYSK